MSRSGSIVIRTINGTGEAIQSQPELFVPVKIKPGWVRSIALMATFAVLLFAQQYIGAASKGPVSLGISVSLFLLAGATGVVAVLGLKKPV